MEKLILFQGDSITDPERSKGGYPSMVAGELGYRYPEQYKCINRGISGNRIVDMYARMKCDIINLAPDYMTLLIGVNDVWHDYEAVPNGVTTKKFEKIYNMLIEEIFEALPNIKLMLLEPFVLKGKRTTTHELHEDFYSVLRPLVEEKAAVTRKIADTYKLPFVELQARFDERYNPENPNYWTSDGVHPTFAGHTLIKHEWLKTFEKMK